MLCLAVFFPIVAGLLLLGAKPLSRRAREYCVEGATIATSLIVLFCLLEPAKDPTVAFTLIEGMPIAFHIDGLGGVFAALVAFL